MSSSTVILKAAGLQTSENELSRPEGALIEASNIIIRRDGIIEQRRGFNLFGSAFPSITDRAKQLTEYRDRILRHYSSKLQFDSTGSGKFIDFNATVQEVQEGLRIKFIESNGNLYFTTSDGIKKIAARNANDFTTEQNVVTNAGAVKALDLVGKTLYVPNSQSSWFPQDSAVAYRVLWAYKDLNNNLIQGSPSQRLTIYNPMLSLLIQDYMRLLGALDSFSNTPLTTARINDKNYIATLGLNLSSSSTQLQANLLALTTKLDNDILYADQSATAPLQMGVSAATISNGICTITFSSGAPNTYLNIGSKIYLEGFNLAAQSEVQKVSFSITPTGGLFRLKYGLNETADINHTDSAAQVQNKLRAVAGLQNVVVTGAIDSTTGLTLTFPSSDGNVGQIVIGSVNTLSPPTVISTSTITEGTSAPTGSINGGQVVTGVTSNTLTFNTDQIGAVVLTSATIKSNEYRSLTAPDAPSTPTTNDELVAMQNYISDIILRLLDEPFTVISSTDKVLVDALDVTTTTTTELTITIPSDINSNYFFQVYRSAIAQATGAGAFDDVVPSDELQLVYEAYPTTAEIAAGSVTFEDVTPDAFRGANLYTNASTGEGILQSNDQPPFAKDVNRYRGSLFFANTRTRHRLELNLLGVQQMLDNITNFSINPKITIASTTNSATYEFVLGKNQQVSVTTTANTANALNGKYFLISSATTDYYIWFDSTGTATDPAISGRTGIKITLDDGALSDAVALAIFNKLSSLYIQDFVVTVLSNVLTIKNTDVGYCKAPAAGTSGFSISTITSGVGESILPEITSLTAVSGASFVSSGTADYFTIYSAFDQSRYVVWFKRGLSTNPAIPGYQTIQIDITGSETAAQVATLIAAALPSADFSTSVNSNIVTITNKKNGFCQPTTENVAAVGFSVSQTQQGRLQVLLSGVASPAQAVDDTARSFVRVINKSIGSPVYAYYLSSQFDVPGKMLLEARSLDVGNKFYVVANNDITGVSFNPDIGPDLAITAIGAGTDPQVVTSQPHGLVTGDTVVLSSTNSIPSVDGVYTVTVVNSTTIKLVGEVVAIPGTAGALISGSGSVYSENEEKINRVYYSKFQQPEAVPALNYFDVGSSDKAILRVVPLRDSLFVFKEDGLYRISGESAPFNLQLFDSSFNTLAADSVAVCNNVIYGWTTQGIQAVTENGSSLISRKIDNIVLKTQSNNYTNFKTATWGVGYESDNSYLVFTVTDPADEVAQICYRYCTLTDTWTTYDISKACGTINTSDDKLYLGPTDTNYIEQERKTFSRLDYCDREVSSVISAFKYNGNKIILPSTTGISVGDVFVQDQSITTTEFNILLEKLDLDSGVADGNYLATLQLKAGTSPRSQLVSLAQKLDADAGTTLSTYASSIATKTGVISAITEGLTTVTITSTGHGLITGRIINIDSSTTTPSINGEYSVTVIDSNKFSIQAKVTVAGVGGNWSTVDNNFDDLKTCYNRITTLLNTDTGVSFNNYKGIKNNTIQEAIITDINIVTKQITLNLSLDYLIGAVTVFKAFETSCTYSPVTLNDPLMLKHMREATAMFETRTFTNGILSFATDLLPEFQPVAFNMDGNGIFGHSVFGSGFFGGTSNSAPFRTYVPRQCQRCRYMVVKFSHKVAREDFRLLGITLTGEISQSTRAYR